ncbi:GntR family transcriptional regulator [Rhodovibrionaceae bacterium A322]
MEPFLSKKDFVKRKLTEAIVAGEYAPGDYLRQNDIAAWLNISSTPVREAFAELQMSGLLVHEAHRGFCVAMIDADRISKIFEARRTVEIAAARLATEQVTDEALAELQALLTDMERQQSKDEFLAMTQSNDRFHQALFSLSQNPFLLELIERLWNALPRFAGWTLEGRREASIKEHHAIFQALSDRNAEAIETAYLTHLAEAEATFIHQLATSTAPHSALPTGQTAP